MYHLRTYGCPLPKRIQRVGELNFRKISDLQKSELAKLFLTKEFDKALSDCLDDNVPGPDGMLMVIKKGWSFMK